MESIKMIFDVEREPEEFHSLIQSVQIEYTNLAKKVPCLHCREDSAGFADHLQNTVSYYEHLAGDLTLPTYRITWGENVGLHLQDEIVQKFWLTLLLQDSNIS